MGTRTCKPPLSGRTDRARRLSFRNTVGTLQVRWCLLEFSLAVMLVPQRIHSLINHPNALVSRATLAIQPVRNGHPQACSVPTPRLCCTLSFHFCSGPVEFHVSSPAVHRQVWGMRPRLLVDVVLALS